MIISWSQKLNMPVYQGKGRINVPIHLWAPHTSRLFPQVNWNQEGSGTEIAEMTDIYRKSSQAFFKVGKPTFIVNFLFLAQTRLEERSPDSVTFAPVSGCKHPHPDPPPPVL